MSITSYSELKSALENWALRPGDTVISDRADEAIDMCEAQMMRGMNPPFPFPTKPLRARQMETRKTDYTIDGEYVALPTGFLEQINIELDSSPRINLEFVTEQIFSQLLASTAAETYPRIFTIVGSDARFGPEPAEDITARFTYYQEITPLDDSNPSNWILTDAPNAYLFGSLMWAYWVTDQGAERAQFAGATFAGIINALQAQEQRSRHGATMVARTLTGMP